MKKIYFEKEAVICSGAKTIIEPTMPIPQYKELTFKSNVEFNDWLISMAPKKIEFVDTGRDLHTIWVHESGEILHSNAQTSIWIGKFIKMDKLQVGLHVWMTLDNKWTEMRGLIVEQITEPQTERRKKSSIKAKKLVK